MWILDEKAEEGPKIIKKEITYVPGLYKIFDEILGKKLFSIRWINNLVRMILVNAADNKQRDKTMSSIEVEINQYVTKELSNLFDRLFSP